MSIVGEEEDLELFDEESPNTEDEGISDSSVTSRNGQSRKLSSKRAGAEALLVNYHLCNRPYRTLERFRKHLSKHVIEDLIKNAPGLSAIREEIRGVYQEVLQTFSTLKPGGGYSDEISCIAKKVGLATMEVNASLVDYLARELWSCLPNPSQVDMDKFHAHFTEETYKVVADGDKRIELQSLLQSILQPLILDESALQWFITDFIRKLSKKVEVFFVKCLKDPYEALLHGESESVRDDPDDLDFKQSVHYIGGSTVKSVLRKSKRSLGTAAWSDIYDCINSKFLVEEGQIGPAEDITLWTESVDRGGLKYINEKVWSFLMVLSSVLKEEEGEDGSIFHEQVFKTVTADDILMLLWDDIIENRLEESVSLLLLQNFCQFFTNTWLAGVILRRKNAIPRLSRDKASLRSRLTR